MKKILPLSLLLASCVPSAPKREPEPPTRQELVRQVLWNCLESAARKMTVEERKRDLGYTWECASENPYRDGRATTTLDRDVRLEVLHQLHRLGLSAVEYLGTVGDPGGIYVCWEPAEIHPWTRYKCGARKK